MSTPSKKPRGIRAASPDDGDVYGVREVLEPDHRDPPGVPDIVAKYAQAARRKRVSAAEEPPPPPRWPMFTGIVTFPLRLNVLGAWLLISCGLMVTAWLTMLWFGPGMVLGGMSAKVFGLPACLMAVLTLGYAATCCLTIAENTSNGWDSFEVSPSWEWSEWVWNFGRIAVLGLQAGMVGAARQVAGLVGVVDADGCRHVGGLSAGVVGALTSEEAWVPLAIKTVLWSLAPLWWAWGLFYVETGAMAWGWTMLTWAGLRGSRGRRPSTLRPCWPR